MLLLQVPAARTGSIQRQFAPVQGEKPPVPLLPPAGGQYSVFESRRTAHCYCRKRERERQEVESQEHRVIEGVLAGCFFLFCCCFNLRGTCCQGHVCWRRPSQRGCRLHRHVFTHTHTPEEEPLPSTSANRKPLP